MITTPGLPGTETCDITMLKVYAQKLDQTYITEWFISTETFSCVKVSQSKSHPYEDGTKQRHT